MGPIRKLFDSLFWKLTHLLTPGLVNAQHRYLATLDHCLKPGARWLDIGCGHQLVPEWVVDSHDKERRLIDRAGFVLGIDLDLPAMARHRSIHRVAMASADRLPFADQSLDLITANMVVEHLDDPQAVLAEINRVLRPGGIFLFHTPNYAHPFTFLAHHVSQRLKNRLVEFLEGRPDHDVFPAHYRMNQRAIIHDAARAAGLDVRRIDLVESSPETLMLGPLVAVEMLFIRFTRWRLLAGLRSNIVTVLAKGADPFAQEYHELVTGLHGDAPSPASPPRRSRAA